MDESKAVDEVFLMRLEECTRAAIDLQKDTLGLILDSNGLVPYLRRYIDWDDADADADDVDGDGLLKLYHEFKRRVPISSYDEDYAPTIRRIAEHGPSYDLSFDHLICFLRSSGSGSMCPKLLPLYDSESENVAAQFAQHVSEAVFRSFAPPRKTAYMILCFVYAGTVTATPAGCKTVAATSLHLCTEALDPTGLFDGCISPSEVILGVDHQQQMYCHLLCGLRQYDTIGAIEAPYAIGVIGAFRFLESKWEQICEDIEYGTVTSEITDPDMRSAVEDLLAGSRPDIANRHRQVFARLGGAWRGIACRLWPSIRHISCVTTGSMQQYYPLLQYYTGEEIPVLAGDYIATECAVGINMDKLLPPHRTRFTIMPTTAYFEFLPFGVGDAGAESLLDIAEVQVGKLYELVVTTFRGLYRYRLGDVVRVVGFHNLSPRVEFVTKAPRDADQVFTERDLITTMDGNLQFMLQYELRGEVLEYASFVDPETSPKHVVLFVEVRNWTTSPPHHEGREPLHFLGKCCRLVEGRLGSTYAMQREMGGLGRLEMCIVRKGTFDELMRMAIEKGSPANQYKVPKILRDQESACFLKSAVVLTTRWNPTDA